MIKLYQFPPAFGLPNASPFCMKLECGLRMAGLKYETVSCRNPARGPKGKLPFIEDGDTRMGDSELIFDYLRRRCGIDLDRGLTDDQKAVSRAFQALLDDRLYWALIYSRWVDPNNWPILREAFFGESSFPLPQVVSELVRYGIRKQLHGQGIGRHSAEEIYAFGRADLGAVAAYLGDRPYFHGELPTRIDASLVSHLANILEAPFPSPLREAAAGYPNLVAYSRRMMQEFFREFT